MTFGRLGRRVIEANFRGGTISSDGGVMLLRQPDRRLGLSKALSDPRDPDRSRLPYKIWWSSGFLVCAVAIRISTSMTVCATSRCCRRWWAS